MSDPILDQLTGVHVHIHFVHHVNHVHHVHWVGDRTEMEEEGKCKSKDGTLWVQQVFISRQYISRIWFLSNLVDFCELRGNLLKFCFWKSEFFLAKCVPCSIYLWLLCARDIFHNSLFFEAIFLLSAGKARWYNLLRHCFLLFYSLYIFLPAENCLLMVVVTNFC